MKSEENKESNIIDIECPICHKNFKFKNVPSNVETFYCMCPNCGTELKRGNPNYIGD